MRKPKLLLAQVLVVRPCKQCSNDAAHNLSCAHTLRKICFTRSTSAFSPVHSSASNSAHANLYTLGAGMLDHSSIKRNTLLRNISYTKPCSGLGLSNKNVSCLQRSRSLSAVSSSLSLPFALTRSNICLLHL
jgi:hypothetical protein